MKADRVGCIIPRLERLAERYRGSPLLNATRLKRGMRGLCFFHTLGIPSAFLLICWVGATWSIALLLVVVLTCEWLLMLLSAWIYVMEPLLMKEGDAESLAIEMLGWNILLAAVMGGGLLILGWVQKG